jgi:hypothetical protein
VAPVCALSEIEANRTRIREEKIQNAECCCDREAARNVILSLLFLYSLPQGVLFSWAHPTPYLRIVVNDVFFFDIEATLIASYFVSFDYRLLKNAQYRTNVNLND